jgi:hypothetical protein
LIERKVLTCRGLSSHSPLRVPVLASCPAFLPALRPALRPSLPPAVAPPGVRRGGI